MSKGGAFELFCLLVERVANEELSVQHISFSRGAVTVTMQEVEAAEEPEPSSDRPTQDGTTP
jgi:hypothetical protein